MRLATRGRFTAVISRNEGVTPSTNTSTVRGTKVWPHPPEGSEADHGVLARVHGNPPTASQELAFELRAYTTQGIVHQGLGLNNSAGGYWWNGRLDQENILRGAKDSLARWCAQPGARGCR